MDNVRDMVGLKEEDLKRFADTHGLKCEALTTVDRLNVRGQNRALKMARQTLERRERDARIAELPLMED